MTIQPISNSNQYLSVLGSRNSGNSNQSVSALNNDFQTLASDILAMSNSSGAGSTSGSGSQDQVSVSQDAVQKALAQVQSDIANLRVGHSERAGTTPSSPSSSDERNECRKRLCHWRRRFHSGDDRCCQSDRVTLFRFRLSSIRADGLPWVHPPFLSESRAISIYPSPSENLYREL